MTQLDPRRYLRLSPQILAGRDDGLFYDTLTGRFLLVKDSTAILLDGQQLVANSAGEFVPFTMSGDGTITSAGVLTIAAGSTDNAALSVPRLTIKQETLLASALTDGGSTTGTKTLTTTIPAGAVFVQSLATNITGFAGDVSATLKLGDGSDDDRYSTGTPSIFATAAAGADMGVPSGTKFHSAAKTIVATVTSSSDITPVLAGGGSALCTFAYFEPV